MRSRVMALFVFVQTDPERVQRMFGAGTTRVPQKEGIIKGMANGRLCQ